MDHPDAAAGDVPELPRWSELIDRCSAVLAELELVDDSEPFDLEVFRDRLARRRGRPILMTPIRLPADDETTVCGVCISTTQADHVYYGETLSPLHDAHCAVHELSHLILEHRSVAPLARPSLGGMWAGSPRSAQSWLASISSSYDEVAEIEADAMATVVLSHRVQDDAPRRWMSSSMMRLGSDRLADAWR